MRRTILGFGVSITLVLAFVSALLVSAQQRRTTPPAQTANDIKVKYKTSTAGQTFESTTMVKGARERSEMRMGHGMDMVNITQCDLKRTVQISDAAKKYVITPMDTGTSSATVPTQAPSSSQPTRRGGLVTYTTTAVDTGERKEMHGFTARHVKTSMTIESSPDACNPVQQKMETDGWYIDLSYGIECETSRAQMTSPPVSSGGCQDRYEFKRTGSARTGYPLVETTTMYGPDGRAMFTTSKEVLELSRAPLDAALFDIPAGYTEAGNAQELYMPSIATASGVAAMNRPASSEINAGEDNEPADSKKPGQIRVGVVQINNKSGRQVSLDALRARLIADIDGGNVEAVPLNAFSVAAAEAEARDKKCDFILYTDLVTLKANKIGGMLGRAAGVSGAGKTEAKVEYKLFAVGESSPRLQSQAVAKLEGDEASAQSAVSDEARSVSAAVRREK